VGSGDPIEIIARDENNVTVANIAALFTHEAHNLTLLRRATKVAALPENLRDFFQMRLRDVE
jgi:MOSC domain-containing protein YiiM